MMSESHTVHVIALSESSTSHESFHDPIAAITLTLTEQQNEKCKAFVSFISYRSLLARKKKQPPK